MAPHHSPVQLPNPGTALSRFFCDARRHLRAERSDFHCYRNDDDRLCPVLLLTPCRERPQRGITLTDTTYQYPVIYSIIGACVCDIGTALTQRILKTLETNYK
jgi:hypothetical protein